MGSSCPLLLGQIGIGMLIFLEGGKPEELEKNPWGMDDSQQQIQPICDTRSHVTSGPGIEPRPQWWEASALTTAPVLLPCRVSSFVCSSCF